MNKFRIRISGIGFLWLAGLLMVLPLRWVVAAGLAALFHEGCHWFAIRACGGHINSLEVGNTGAVMAICDLSVRQELFCALAGPLGGLLLLIFMRWFPEIAVCAAVQSVFNLLPVYPLDGGRCLRCVAGMLFPAAADTVCLWAARCCCFLLIAFGVYAAGMKWGFAPLIIAGFVAVKVIRGKIPCKHRHSAVQ